MCRLVPVSRSTMGGLFSLLIHDNIYRTCCSYDSATFLSFLTPNLIFVYNTTGVPSAIKTYQQQEEILRRRSILYKRTLQR